MPATSRATRCGYCYRELPKDPDRTAITAEHGTVHVSCAASMDMPEAELLSKIFGTPGRAERQREGIVRAAADAGHVITNNKSSEHPKRHGFSCTCGLREPATLTSGQRSELMWEHLRNAINPPPPQN